MGGVLGFSLPPSLSHLPSPTSKNHYNYLFHMCRAIANFTVALNQVLRWSTDSIHIIHRPSSVYTVYYLLNMCCV